MASVTSLSCLASQIRRGAVEDEGASEGSSRVARPNGLDALRLTPVYQPNVVLLDVLMPGMLAIDVLKVLRRDHPAIPVVMVTGILDEAAARELLARGALDYVRKPFNLEALAGILETAMVLRGGARPAARRAAQLGVEPPPIPAPIRAASSPIRRRRVLSCGRCAARDAFG